MHRQSLFYKLEILLVIETLALMMAMISAPQRSAQRPPSVIAPVIKLESGVKVCELA